MVWDSEALIQLQEHYEYISQDSQKSAKKIKESLIKETKKLAYFPERYSLDRYKIENDGTYRAFEKFRLRVTYRITHQEVRVLRVRHTSRNPLKY